MLPKSWESCLAAAQVDFELIEADFQQFYNLDLESLLVTSFQRYARLLLHLPFESRFVQKYSPSKDWSWEKETQARILNMLDAIYSHLANMTKGKGQPSRKVAELFQPEYVKKAKAEAEEARREAERISREDFEEIKEFWKTRNYKVRKDVN